MSLKLDVDLAKSLSTARWKQTLVAAVGVTFSITMFIALLVFMTGINNLFDNLILNRAPHVHLYNEIERNPHQPIALSDRFQNAYNFISSIKAPNSREEIYNSAAIIKTILNDTRVAGVDAKVHTPAFFY